MSSQDMIGSGTDKLGYLLSNARDSYRALHGSQVWIHHPFTCKGTSEVRDIHRDAAKLDEAVTAIGAFLRERLGLPSGLVRAGIDHALGSAYFDCYYVDMISRLENVLNWFREEKWDKLRQEGCLDDQEYQELNRHRETVAVT